LKKEKVSWKYTILTSIGLIPLMAFFLFTRYKVKGHIDKVDWIIAICAILLLSSWLLINTYRANRRKGE